MQKKNPEHEWNRTVREVYVLNKYSGDLARRTVMKRKLGGNTHTHTHERGGKRIKDKNIGFMRILSHSRTTTFTIFYCGRRIQSEETQKEK